jgi:hypothetical protein
MSAGFWRAKPNLSTLIHDTNSNIGLMRAEIWRIRRIWKERAESPEEETKTLDNIERYIKSLMNNIDLYYKKERDLYEQKGSDRG